MNAQDIREFKVELLDEIHELASEPVVDPEPIRRKVESFFSKLEEAIGEKTGTAAR
jgi:hypothetical protein